VVRAYRLSTRRIMAWLGHAEVVPSRDVVTATSASSEQVMQGFLRTARNSSFFWRSESTAGLPLRGKLATLAVVQYFLYIFWTARCKRACSSATDLVLHPPSNFSMMTLRSSVGISDLFGRFSLSAAGAGCCGDMVMVVGEKAVAFVFASRCVFLRERTYL
jgi:hypothetical protein